MLVLTRKPGERILIGDAISMTVVAVGAGWVRVGFEAPGSIPILRSELTAKLEVTTIGGRAPERVGQKVP
jgi:carbon storage regulator